MSKNLKSKVGLFVEVPLNKLVEQLTADTTEDALFDLIRALDLEMASWNLTLRLAEYFAAEKAKHDQEEAEEIGVASVECCLAQSAR